MIVGYQSNEYGPSRRYGYQSKDEPQNEDRPIVYFMQLGDRGTWQKVGTGQLFLNRDEFPLNAVKYSHLPSGGEVPGLGIQRCCCENKTSRIRDSRSKLLSFGEMKKREEIVSETVMTEGERKAFKELTDAPECKQM